MNRRMITRVAFNPKGDMNTCAKLFYEKYPVSVNFTHLIHNPALSQRSSNCSGAVSSSVCDSPQSPATGLVAVLLSSNIPLAGPASLKCILRMHVYYIAYHLFLTISQSTNTISVFGPFTETSRADLEWVSFSFGSLWKQSPTGVKGRLGMKRGGEILCRQTSFKKKKEGRNKRIMLICANFVLILILETAVL